MRTIASFKTAFLLALTVVVTSSLAATRKDLEAAMSHDGLQKTSVKGLDLAYALPGASLAAYKRIKLDPVDVEFDKAWDPTRPGSWIKLSSDEREKIRANVAKLVEDEFARELQTGGAYQIASEAAPDVLRVKVSILDLYLNAPSDSGAGRSRTYIRSAGRMTLLADLSDAASGQTLARVADHREADSIARTERANRLVNEDAAREVAGAWARILRKALDKAHAIGS